jgi:hypothetical protein
MIYKEQAVQGYRDRCHVCIFLLVQGQVNTYQTINVNCVNRIISLNYGRHDGR